MKNVNQWLEEYGESHRNAANKKLHWICVPIIVVSLVGLLSCLPFPERWRGISPILNWGTLLLACGVVYYIVLSTKLAVGMVLFVALVMLAIDGLARLPAPLWQTCSALFVLAWIGQFIGHHVEGKRPSFFKDVQFLMIGPLWLLSFIYRKLHIRF
ncbi:MAG TPA: Mpo1-like protein [Steroidobacteraceae bacterium]|nr:Mpo1-like protein [Steroidobacteraceae bacterium]